MENELPVFAKLGVIMILLAVCMGVMFGVFRTARELVAEATYSVESLDQYKQVEVSERVAQEPEVDESEGVRGTGVIVLLVVLIGAYYGWKYYDKYHLTIYYEDGSVEKYRIGIFVDEEQDGLRKYSVRKYLPVKEEVCG